MARTRIKVCGIKDIETAYAAVEAGADSIGFVFVRSSPRFIEPEAATEIMASLPPMISTVGVFMNHSLDAFMEIEELCPTTHSQLHGNEDVKLVKQCGPAIKGIRFDPDTIAKDLQRWTIDEVEAFLVDGPLAGSGESFDWNLLAPYMEAAERPVFLAGGLTPQNVGDAIRSCRPYAVDVSSGVERERGVKDIELIQRFCEAVQQADAS